ncbi:collagen alpha-1(XI) chain-like [Homarus americanus]|uniref:collagen alpha-1(XI) chain-like n=1 Tax=Homarus americanus TaxID=6706 RepID=UPI001C444DB5|nr:collagen alpha-1(XI) chain-like [Homarus americanus]
MVLLASYSTKAHTTKEWETGSVGIKQNVKRGMGPPEPFGKGTLSRKPQRPSTGGGILRDPPSVCKHTQEALPGAMALPGALPGVLASQFGSGSVAPLGALHRATPGQGFPGSLPGAGSLQGAYKGRSALRGTRRGPANGGCTLRALPVRWWSQEPSRALAPQGAVAPPAALPPALNPRVPPEAAGYQGSFQGQWPSRRQRPRGPFQGVCAPGGTRRALPMGGSTTGQETVSEPLPGGGGALRGPSKGGATGVRSRDSSGPRNPLQGSVTPGGFAGTGIAPEALLEQQGQQGPSRVWGCARGGPCQWSGTFRGPVGVVAVSHGPSQGTVAAQGPTQGGLLKGAGALRSLPRGSGSPRDPQGCSALGSCQGSGTLGALPGVGILGSFQGGGIPKGPPGSVTPRGAFPGGGTPNGPARSIGALRGL